MLPVALAVVLVFIEGVYFIIYQSDGWTVQWQVCMDYWNMTLTISPDYLSFLEGRKCVKRIEPLIRSVPNWKFK